MKKTFLILALCAIAFVLGCFAFAYYLIAKNETDKNRSQTANATEARRKKYEASLTLEPEKNEEENK